MIPVLLILCWTDCKYRRLPNLYTLGLAVLGLVLRFAFGGVTGLLGGVFGGFVCALFLLGLFLKKGASDDDVKVISATRIITGLYYRVEEKLFVSQTGLFFELGMLVVGQERASHMKHWLRTFPGWRCDRKDGAEKLSGKAAERDHVPFGVAIAPGTVFPLFHAYNEETPA